MSQIRVCAFSDSHGEFPRVPPCDLLLLAGDIERDFSGPGNPMNGYAQANWINSEFRDWLHTVQATEIVLVPGNHSFAWFRLKPMIERDNLRCHVLIDSGIELFGLNIWGTPWVGGLPDWAFNLTELQLEHRWAQIPRGTDILVTHDAPSEVVEWHGTGVIGHGGSTTLLQHVERVQPKLHVFGHLHEAKGEWLHGPTRLVNVSVKDNHRRLSYPVYSAYLDAPQSSGLQSGSEDSHAA